MSESIAPIPEPICPFCNGTRLSDWHVWTCDAPDPKPLINPSDSVDAFPTPPPHPPREGRAENE